MKTRHVVLLTILLSILVSCSNTGTATDSPALAPTLEATDPPADAAPTIDATEPSALQPTTEPTTGQSNQPDVIVTLRADGRFTRFLAALEANGLVELLQTGGPWTVLAPTEAGFAAPALTSRGPVSPAEIEAQLGDPQTATLLLSYHIVSGAFSSDQLQSEISSSPKQGRPRWHPLHQWRAYRRSRHHRRPF